MNFKSGSKFPYIYRKIQGDIFSENGYYATTYYKWLFLRLSNGSRSYYFATTKLLRLIYKGENSSKVVRRQQEKNAANRGAILKGVFGYYVTTKWSILALKTIIGSNGSSLEVL